LFGKTKSNLWLDITIFIAFITTTITGLLLWLVLPEGPGSRSAILLGLTKESWISIHNWAGIGMLMGASDFFDQHISVYLICDSQSFRSDHLVNSRRRRLSRQTKIENDTGNKTCVVYLFPQ
jgi:hypothetical protein